MWDRIGEGDGFEPAGNVVCIVLDVDYTMCLLFRSLSLANNSFTGGLPSGWSGLTQLQYVCLRVCLRVCWDADACVNGHTPCRDDFFVLLWSPTWIPMCTDIRSLLLSTNLLSGTLPDNVTYWSGLRTLT